MGVIFVCQLFSMRSYFETYLRTRKFNCFFYYNITFAYPFQVIMFILETVPLFYTQVHAGVIIQTGNIFLYGTHSLQLFYLNFLVKDPSIKIHFSCEKARVQLFDLLQHFGRMSTENSIELQPTKVVWVMHYSIHAYSNYTSHRPVRSAPC